MVSQLRSGIVRLFAPNGAVVGAGFLVAERHVLTCAHVVARALSLPDATPELPPTEVQLDFPLITSGRRQAAHPVFWQPLQPDGGGDVALLELVGKPPPETRPIRLVTAEDVWGHPFRAFGFPTGQDDGVWASGVLRDRQATGWLQIEDIKATGFRVEPGFSGGPVWDDELKGVVGMVVAAERQPATRTAFIIVAQTLIEVWQPLTALAIRPCPYRGLLPFRERDEPFFFGREDFAAQLFEAVQRKALVAVIVGSSGSGKSSVVFAGLVPRLRRERTWLIADFRPGSRPFHQLAIALLPLLESQLSETDRLLEANRQAEAFVEGSLLLSEVVQRILQKHSVECTEHLLLFVDQLEELYTLCPDPDVRRRFIDSLLQASEAERPRRIPSFTVVFTLRADFMGQALTHRPFADALQGASLMLGPMTREELARAIEKPAQKWGVDFEAGLVERILDDVGKTPGNLPLLEFALTGLWDQQVDFQLTHTAYNDIGKVQGALMHHAEGVYERLSETEQEAARRVLIQMVHPGQGTEDTLRLATHSELDDAGWTIVQRLADERLVVTGRDETTGQETAQVIHEVLIRGWKRLQEWMDADRAFRSWQECLRDALRQWEEQPDEGALLHGALLNEAESWLKRRGVDLSQSEREYIQAGVALRERTARRMRLALCVITMLALMFSTMLYAFLTSTYEFDPVSYIFGCSKVKRENPFVPLGGGQMVFGSEIPDLGTGEQISQSIIIESFAMQQTEVTNHQYRICRRAGGCRADPIIRQYYEDSAYDDHPVVYVNAFQAQEFCHWLGGELPESEQWERAVRGLDGRPWPWVGDTLTPDHARLYWPESPPTSTVKAKDFPLGATPEGIQNLVGNVWEWTRTQLVPQDDGAYYSQVVWNGENPEVALAMRGGSWGFTMTRITEVQIALPEQFDEFLGFRCVIHSH